MATFCPYCDKEIEDTVHRIWARDYLGRTIIFEMKCPKCGKMLGIDVESEPVFLPHKKMEGKDEK